MKIKHILCSMLAIMCCMGAAQANWQYRGDYPTSGYYKDDGSRFVLSFRGGASYGMGTIENNVGSLTTGYWIDTNKGVVISDTYYNDCAACVGVFDYAGMGDVADLSAADDYSSFSFAYGASVGWTVPHSPQWRLELGWDHISESDYNATPLFEGDLHLVDGDIPNS